MAEFMNLTSADGFTFPAYVARPEGKPVAAVVVLQEIFGVNAHIREVAQRYADAGFLAVAPATFHRVKTGVELGYSADDITAGRGLKAAVEGLPAPGVMPDIQASIDYAAAQLTQLSAKHGKVGVVGYCWGGLLTWRAACLLDGISAAVPYYGGGMTEPQEAQRQPTCPVQCHFGEVDQSIPLGAARAFAAAHPSVETHFYPAHHGFNCDHRGAYDAAAAALAQERTLAFFARHLA